MPKWCSTIAPNASRPGFLLGFRTCYVVIVYCGGPDKVTRAFLDFRFPCAARLVFVPAQSHFGWQFSKCLSSRSFWSCATTFERETHLMHAHKNTRRIVQIRSGSGTRAPTWVVDSTEHVIPGHIRTRRPVHSIGHVCITLARCNQIRITRAGSRTNIIAWIALNEDSTPCICVFASKLQIITVFFVHLHANTLNSCSVSP